MANKLPDHVVAAYGSARAFRAKKRRAVKEMRQLLGEQPFREAPKLVPEPN